MPPATRATTFALASAIAPRAILSSAAREPKPDADERSARIQLLLRDNIQQIRTARCPQRANQKIERHFAQSVNANESLPVQLARPGFSSAQIAPSRERRNRRYLTVDHTHAVRFLHAYILRGDG